jgi:hypothetical protein
VAAVTSVSFRATTPKGLDLHERIKQPLLRPASTILTGTILNGKDSRIRGG